MSDLKAKRPQIAFCWDSAPDPDREDYSAPPDPLAGFKGPTTKGREGDGKGPRFALVWGPQIVNPALDTVVIVRI